MEQEIQTQQNAKILLGEAGGYHVRKEQAYDDAVNS